MKVYIAEPGITGYRKEMDVDTSKRIGDMYYKSSSGMICATYCYRAENATDINKAFDEMIAEEKAMKDRHYRKLIQLRTDYGV